MKIKRNDNQRKDIHIKKMGQGSKQKEDNEMSCSNLAAVFFEIVTPCMSGEGGGGDSNSTLFTFDGSADLSLLLVGLLVPGRDPLGCRERAPFRLLL